MKAFVRLEAMTEGQPRTEGTDWNHADPLHVCPPHFIRYIVEVHLGLGKQLGNTSS